MTSCGYNLASNNKNTPVSCPSILFGSGHKFYVASSDDDISIDNIDYQGEINNAEFSKECNTKDNIFSSELSILFVLKPLSIKAKNIEMPFYVAILNQNKELQDLVYFSVSGKFKKDSETKKPLETEVIKKILLQHKSINKSSIIILGYLLDKKKDDILN